MKFYFSAGLRYRCFARRDCNMKEGMEVMEQDVLLNAVQITGKERAEEMLKEVRRTMREWPGSGRG